MAQFTVTLKFAKPFDMTIEVEADDVDEAKELAIDNFYDDVTALAEDAEPFVERIVAHA